MLVYSVISIICSIIFRCVCPISLSVSCAKLFQIHWFIIRVINRTIKEPIDCALMISVMGKKPDYQIMWYFTENISVVYQRVLVY